MWRPGIMTVLFLDEYPVRPRCDCPDSCELPVKPSAPTNAHCIRLRGPWTVTWQEAAAGDDEPAPQPESQTVRLPASWRALFGERAGRALFQRTFHQPTNLSPDERVCVVLADVPGEVRLRLNGRDVESLSRESRRRAFDITPLLRDANRLEIEITYNPAENKASPGGLWQAVLLEIARNYF